MRPVRFEEPADEPGGLTAALREPRERLRAAVDARWQIARLLPDGGWPLVAAAGSVNVLLAVLPVAFIVATSVMIGQLPDAIAAGLDTPAWDGLIGAFGVAGAVFVAQQVLGPAQTALGERLARRIDGLMFDRLVAASLRSPGIGPLEDPIALDHLAEATRELEHGLQSPGGAAAGLLGLIARYGQLLGYTVVTGIALSWPAALGIAVVALLFRNGQAGGLRRLTAMFWQFAPQRRRTMYLRELASAPPAGKEIRIFDLSAWLRAEHRQSYLGWVLPLWAHRRRIYLAPFVRYTILGAVVTTITLGYAGFAAGHTVRLTALALAIQAMLAAIRLGEHYPEVDVPTQLGMTAYAAVRAFEADVARQTPDGTDPAPAVTRRPEREIRFERVDFGYPGQPHAVFEGFDLTVAAGRCTAIVGLNGAGKTTLVKLLTRLYEPGSGAITVDGRDLSTLPVDAWRRQLGVIFQDFVHYPVSAGENIAYGAIEHLNDRVGVRTAAALAGADRVLNRLPSGVDTPLAVDLSGGTELSGGEWQRIALARAMFAMRHGASVLILDEPTASLDMRSEATFYDRFVRLTKGATTILISHRFSTVRRADRIVVLDRGRVAEQGSHEELLARNGEYARLFRLQAERFATDEAANEAADEAMDRRR